MNDPRWGELDRYLFSEGRHRRLWRHLGAHLGSGVIGGGSGGEPGVWFAVWAPDAQSVSVIGDFNHFVAGVDAMAPVGSTGVWSAFVAGAGVGDKYKFAIVDKAGRVHEKADPMARAAEIPPRTASVVTADPEHVWGDAAWVATRSSSDPWRERMAIYEVHVGSFHGKTTYRRLGHELGPYVRDLGFTHVELLPVAEHPFYASWGYQVSSYFAPSARYGYPDDFRAFVDAMHGHGIGVILDWVPAHFPKDDWSLGRFDGTALYEHADPRQGEHPDWGTYVFNFGRTEVRNFLIANALYWLEEFHIDGLRVDAVASMLYLDYSRKEGEWVPNREGGRESLEAISFLRELNTVVHAEHPGVLMIAEESTAWPSVSRPADSGGLGFGFKWNMGWMHDTLRYFSLDPVYRQHHHDDVTFGLLYAFHENFILPLSHDEVVHGKGSLLAKMAGDAWQKFANLRALYAWMWAHPGKKLLFMGCELAPWTEWDADRSLDWELLQQAPHAGVRAVVERCNAIAAAEPALYERDFEPEGFGWLVADDAGGNVYAFCRWADGSARPVVCVANLSPVPRPGYGLQLPRPGSWVELLNTDDHAFGGSGVVNGTVDADELGRATVLLPPLGVLWLTPAATAS